jgi:hypothetical protein
MWAEEEEEWVKFRTTPHTGHVPSNITTLVQQKFLQGSAGIEKEKKLLNTTISTLSREKDNEVAATALLYSLGTEDVETCVSITLIF